MLYPAEDEDAGEWAEVHAIGYAKGKSNGKGKATG